MSASGRTLPRGPLKLVLPSSPLPSAEEIAAAFRAKQPLRFTFASPGECVQRWSVDAIVRDHGNATVRIIVDAPAGAPWERRAAEHTRDATLSEYVALLRSPARQRPCYLALEPLTRFPGFAPPSRASALSGKGADGRISIGSAGVQIGVHFDYEDNLFVQLAGAKRYTLVAPEYSGMMSASRFNMTQSEIDDASRPDLTRYPRYAAAKVIEGVIGPGQALAIPRTWWHHFESLGETISLSFFSGRASVVEDLVPILQTYGVGYALGVAKQFFVHGVMGRPYRTGLYSHPPTGQVLFDTMRQRLTGRAPRTDGSFFEV